MHKLVNQQEMIKAMKEEKKGEKNVTAQCHFFQILQMKFGNQVSQHQNFTLFWH